MKANCKINVLINGQWLGFTDFDAMLDTELQDKIKHARYRIVDGKHRMTWVHDRLLGLVPENCHG